MENRFPVGLAALVLAFELGFAGCATYTDRMHAARVSLERGDFDGSIEELNKVLGVRSHDELPAVWGENTALAALERGTLLQTVGQYGDSARDLSAAERELELLDLELDTPGSIGKYVYSDSAEVYKASPTEKISLNAVNMLNYLALGDLPGAAVEARRFTVMQEYLKTEDESSAPGAFGSYVAGFVFERLGQYARARRHYSEAIERWGIEAHELGSAPSTGGMVNGKNGRARGTPDTADAESGVPREPMAQILAVIALGRVPYKVPERISVGAAVGLAGIHMTGDSRWLRSSTSKVLVYPGLLTVPSRYTGASVEIDGCEVPVRLLTDLGEEIAREYGAIKPKILGAALSRVIARTAAAEGTRAAARDAGGSDSVFGVLAALGVERTLAGFDKPDTRSWMFMPGRIFVARAAVDRGEHAVNIYLNGYAEKVKRLRVDMPASSFVVVVVTDPR